MSVEQKYCKIGEEGEVMPVKDIYCYIYDCGDGRTVLRIKIDGAIVGNNIEAMLDKFTNANNLPIYEMNKVSSNYDPSIPEAINHVDPEDEDYVYRVLSMHENFCMGLQWSFKNGEYELELTKKKTEDIIAEENAQTTNDISEALLELASLL